MRQYTRWNRILEMVLLNFLVSTSIRLNLHRKLMFYNFFP